MLITVSLDELTNLLREAAQAHHVYETHLGKRDEQWAEWYAQFVALNASQPASV